MATSRIDSSINRRTFIGSLIAGAMASCAALRADEAALRPALDDLRRWFEAGAPAGEMGRQFLLDPKLAYFNTGTLGASPRVVVEAHAAFLRAIEANPASLLFGELGDQMEEVRKKAALFMGADLDEITFTANTTSGLNMVAESLKLRPGDEVLTSTQEHGGGRIGWEHARAQQGVVLREVTLPTPARSAGEVLAAIEGALTERTRVISLSHVNTITGLRLPIVAVAKLAAQKGAILVIDGAQAPGMVPVDVHALGCDVYATSCHKWMLGPKGCGLLYVRRDFQKQVPSVFLKAGLGAYTVASGTRNVPQILALGVALDTLAAIGLPRIEAHDLLLTRRLHEQLSTIRGVEIASSPAPELQSAMTTFQLPPGHTGTAVAEMLARKGIVVKVVPGEHLQNRALRISTHLYNTRREVDLLVSEVKHIVSP